MSKVIDGIKESFSAVFSKPKITLLEQTVQELNKKVVNQTSQINLQQLTIDQLADKALFKTFKDAKVKSVLSTLYQKVVAKKTAIVEMVDQHRDNYLYTGILNMMIEDSLAPNPITNDIVYITSPNATFKTKLDELQAKVNIDGILASFMDDFLSYGEYYLKMDVEAGKGITAIHDSVEQAKTVAVYAEAEPKFFMTNEKEKTELDSKQYAFFCLGGSKLRIKVDDKNMSEYVRMGKPMLWGTFDLLDQLSLLTVLIPASYVQKINSSSLIGVQVPDGTQAADLKEILQTYERVLNDKDININSSGTRITDILASIGRFKAVPIFSTHGDLRKADPRFDEMQDVSVLEDLRKCICASIGVPYPFLFSGEVSKNETLKLFARYVRKLGTIQRAVREGLTQIALSHLVNSGLSPKPSDIEVKFTNSLISVEDLDRLEYVDTLVSVVNNIATSLNGIATSMKYSIDTNEMNKFLKDFLKIVTLDKIFKVTKPVIEPPSDEAPPGI